ncbi:PH domain-containing protein [Streptomyces sp. enrichment culture]|uniref:PH domain-containing protein n=1 Tax=Streptomyces sp. enrichment culture TaxID=1795815 RepID=UPI003F54FD2F
MTTPEPQSPAPEPKQPPVSAAPDDRDQVHRSPAGIAGGVLLLGVCAWFGIDASLRGEGRTPWLALASLLLAVPLIVAFTLRPAIHVNEDRLRVRNPFRLIVLPWGRVASLRSGYSNEVFSDAGTTYQLWALPVSLRARKRAARREMRATGERASGVDVRTAGHGPGGAALRRGGRPSAAADDGPVRGRTDGVMDELRELHERRQGADAAQGAPVVRWAYEILAPAAAGAVLLAVLLATG